MTDASAARRPSDVQSQLSEAESLSAQEYITAQLQLEADAREALPFQFDTCTKPFGPLRQSLFSCLTCNPPSANPYVPAGICYSCSISCHGEHELVELFAKREFECDCGTTRMPDSSPCTLRTNPKTGLKGGVTQDVAKPSNKYNHNFAGRFCACDDAYDPAKEKGTMFQCLGLAHTDSGGCGEDWWHPECLVGLKRHVHDKPEDPKASAPDAGTEGVQAAPGPRTSSPVLDAHTDDPPLPPGFPAEDQFDHFICYKCAQVNPWLKLYAGSTGFLAPVYLDGNRANLEASKKGEGAAESSPLSMDTIPTEIAGVKRKSDGLDDEPEAKRARAEIIEPPSDSLSELVNTPQTAHPTAKHSRLSPVGAGEFSVFVKEDFRDHLCHCADCFPRLRQYPQLLELEDTYEPPVSESDQEEGHGSVGSRSLLDRGEAALSTMDRMRAIEGVMAYNNLRDKVKAFLQPFAESGQAVGAEDVKAYFARLRGDEEAIRTAGAGANGDETGDSRREQGGY